MYRDYSPKGVQFVYVYKALAHPETNGYVQPFTLQERLMHVKEAERTLGSQIRWICDNMDNEIKHALGNAPNSEFIFDPEGRVVVRRAWSNPNQLRADLARLVGPVERPTRVEDLNLPTAPPPQVAPRGIVPRVNRPPNLRPLVQQPIAGEKKLPFYVKLRAEADDSLLRRGEGTLYVGFHLDPLYHVHWNNLVKPIRVTFVTADGEPDSRVEPNVLEGPKVDAPADIDPREFLVRVRREPRDNEPLRVKVAYFACYEKEGEQGWCLPVSQEYRIEWQEDRDGGRARSGGRPGSRPVAGNRPPNRPGFGLPPNGRPGRPLGVAAGMLMGRIVSVDAESGRVTVQTRDGRETLSVGERAVFVRNRQRVGLGDFRPGDMVRVRYSASRKSKIIQGMMARSQN